jgi:hypothetical protein
VRPVIEIQRVTETLPVTGAAVCDRGPIEAETQPAQKPNSLGLNGE